MFDKVSSNYKWNELKDYVQKNLENEKTGHDFSHIERVMKNALLIGKDLNVNYDILLASILMHDISYKDKPSKTHNIESAEIAKNILLDYGFKEDLNKEVYHSIINHCRSFNPHDPIEKLSQEAKILYDADTLDALGAIGILRMISFSVNQQIPYFKSEKDSVDETFYGNIKFLEKMKDNLILESSKNIAEERMKIVYDFLEQMKDECN